MAFLTLTARYHREIVLRVGQKPIACAEIFAKATRTQLGPSQGTASLERVQALLLVGWHEVTHLEGGRGWATIGAAIREVQRLECQYIDLKAADTKADVGDDYARAERIIDREIERRTFWSCFIMDRWLSCGEKRPQMLNTANLHIQLPCSDKAFSHGQHVRTRHLGEDDKTYAHRRQKWQDRLEPKRNFSGHSDQDCRDNLNNDKIEWEVGKEEGDLSVYVQLVDHFGRVMKWSIDVGRR